MATITIWADSHRPLTIGGDWAEPLNLALDTEIKERNDRGPGASRDIIELIFGGRDYRFQTELKIKESLINIVGDIAGTTRILHDPWIHGRHFSPFFFRHGSDTTSDLTGIGELFDVNISDLTVEFLGAGGYALGGVSFSNCHGFNCERINVIGSESGMVGSHTNGIVVTGGSSGGFVLDCDVARMSAPGIYISNSYNVDVIRCNVHDSVSRGTGIRVSSSQDIDLIRCNASTNNGSGLQISHNTSKLLGSPGYPGRILVATEDIIIFEFDESENAFPSSQEAGRLGAENLDTHKIQEIQVSAVVPTDHFHPGRKRHFEVSLSGGIPFRVVPDGHELTEMKLHVNFVPNRNITISDCTSNYSLEQGIEIGTEQPGAVGSEITLTRVTCEGNALCGIRVSSAEVVSIYRCNCINNGGDGIYVLDNARAELFDLESLELIFWKLTSDVIIDYCDIRNNRNAGINILGVNNVTIYRTTIFTDEPSRHASGCIHVAPLTFLTGIAPLQTPHTKRIENLNIHCGFTGLATYREEFVVDEAFINRLITRFFPTRPLILGGYPPSRYNEDGGFISRNENVVVSGRYELSFVGNPNGHINAPYGSVYTNDSETPTYVFGKCTEEHSNEGWSQDGCDAIGGSSGLGHRRISMYRPNKAPNIDPATWPKPLAFFPKRKGGARPAFPLEHPHSRGRKEDQAGSDFDRDDDQGLAQGLVLHESTRGTTVVGSTITGDVCNLKGSCSSKQTICQIDGTTKSEIITLNELGAVPPQQLEKQRRPVIEILERQKKTKIEVLGPKVLSKK